MNTRSSQLEHLVSRALTLFSRPTVALELVRLTEEPTIDAQAIKECIAQDPALTCKLLRVVNSSLYGLQRPVADLNQAIGLLGIKPLKLLVLGFNLPDTLFSEVAARQLQWYWTNTLTRAVAARLLCEQLWRQPGDEAFLVGLLHDIGILVLLRELGEPYARFLNGVIDENCDLATLEQETLGFDHVQLSAALLAKWQLPQRFVDAIDVPKRTARLTRLNSPEGDLPQILHLAELLEQLVGQHRLGALGELMEAGKLYRGMTKGNLRRLVEDLQPHVHQLADVLSLELMDRRDYVQVLLEAQRQLGILGEQVVGDFALHDDEQMYARLLAQATQLTGAMQAFLAGKRTSTPSKDTSHQHAAHYGQHTTRGFVGRRLAEPASEVALLQSLAAAATRCRESRQELSLLLVESNQPEGDPTSTTVAASKEMRGALSQACDACHEETPTILSAAAGLLAVILANCERRTALAIAHNAIQAFGKNMVEGRKGTAPAPTLSIGVATVGVVPKNFDAARFVERAARCLAAARSGGMSAVKSIED